jgi:hypothetical protein
MINELVAYLKRHLVRLHAGLSNILPYLKTKKPVLSRAARELFVPTLVGLGWAVIALRKNDIDLYTAVSLGAAAFFFVFSMQGQFLRMDENVRDEEHAKATKVRSPNSTKGWTAWTILYAVFSNRREVRNPELRGWSFLLRVSLSFLRARADSGFFLLQHCFGQHLSLITP